MALRDMQPARTHALSLGLVLFCDLAFISDVPWAGILGSPSHIHTVASHCLLTETLILPHIHLTLVTSRTLAQTSMIP